MAFQVSKYNRGEGGREWIMDHRIWEVMDNGVLGFKI